MVESINSTGGTASGGGVSSSDVFLFLNFILSLFGCLLCGIIIGQVYIRIIIRISLYFYKKKKKKRRQEQHEQKQQQHEQDDDYEPITSSSSSFLIIKYTLLFLISYIIVVQLVLPTTTTTMSFSSFSTLSSHSSTALLRLLFILIGLRIGELFIPIVLTGSIACGKSTVAQYLLLEESSSEEVKEQENDNNKEDINNDDHSNDNDKDTHTSSSSSANHHNNTSSSRFVLIDTDKIAHDILLPPCLLHDPTISVYNKIISIFKNDDILEDENDEKTTTKTKEEDVSSLLKIDRRKLGEVIFKDKQKRRLLNKVTHPKIMYIMFKRMINELYSFKRNNKIVLVDIPLLFETGFLLKQIFVLNIVVVCTSVEEQYKRLQDRNKDLTKEQCYDRISSQMSIDKKIHMGDVIIKNDPPLIMTKEQLKRYVQYNIKPNILQILQQQKQDQKQQSALSLLHTTVMLTVIIMFCYNNNILQ